MAPSQYTQNVGRKQSICANASSIYSIDPTTIVSYNSNMNTHVATNNAIILTCATNIQKIEFF
jgi:hypothetical protein